MNNLKRISSVPIGTKVLLYWKDTEHIEDGTVYINENGAYHVLYDGESMPIMPSHWCELPILE